MTVPETATRDREVVTVAGRIELYRGEADFIVDQGAYIIAYRRIYRLRRTEGGAYCADVVYTSRSPMTARGRYHVYDAAEYDHYRQWLDREARP